VGEASKNQEIQDEAYVSLKNTHKLIFHIYSRKIYENLSIPIG
jgi:hypothetical protein